MSCEDMRAAAFELNSVLHHDEEQDVVKLARIARAEIQQLRANQRRPTPTDPIYILDSGPIMDLPDGQLFIGPETGEVKRAPEGGGRAGRPVAGVRRFNSLEELLQYLLVGSRSGLEER